MKISSKMKEDIVFAKEMKKPEEIIDIAINIHRLRKGKKWTQARLAKETGMRQSNISRLESAYYDGYSLKTLAKIAKSLGVKVSDLTKPLNLKSEKNKMTNHTAIASAIAEIEIIKKSYSNYLATNYLATNSAQARWLKSITDSNSNPQYEY